MMINETMVGPEGEATTETPAPQDLNGATSNELLTPTDSSSKTTKRARRPPKARTKAQAKPKSRKAQAAPASKKKATKRPTTTKGKAKMASKQKSTKKKASTKKSNGTQRRTANGTAFHVMSVHIPLTLLKKLDAKCRVLSKAGKPNANRSAFAVAAISSKL